MKKACNCLLLALLIQVVVSCGNLNMEEPSKVYSDSSIKTLTITTGTSVAKTIMPLRLDYSSLTYYFAIENLITNQKSLHTFTSQSDQTSLSFPIELESGYYKISVYALEAAVAQASPFTGTYLTDFTSGDLNTACVMAGTSSVDLRQDESVRIVLSSNGLNQNGIVSLKFYTNGWTLDTTKFSASCGIKNRAGTLVGLDHEVNLNGVGNTEPAAGAIPLYYSANIPAGTYTLYVKYTNTSDSSIVYTWEDSIMVLSKQTIQKNIALIDIIDHAPAAPSQLKASYLDFDSSSVWCYVNFTWEDNSNNEKGFQMELKAIAAAENDSAITSDMAACWDNLMPDSRAVTGAFTTSATDTSQAFDNDGAGGEGIRKDGSLNKNNTSATFKLSRGYRYLARICSVGNFKAGNSAYTYVDFTAGGTGKADYSDFATDAKYIKVGD